MLPRPCRLRTLRTPRCRSDAFWTSARRTASPAARSISDRGTRASGRGATSSTGTGKSSRTPRWISFASSLQDSVCALFVRLGCASVKCRQGEVSRTKAVLYAQLEEGRPSWAPRDVSCVDLMWAFCKVCSRYSRACQSKSYMLRWHSELT
jgi:hypothetical protein